MICQPPLRLSETLRKGAFKCVRKLVQAPTLTHQSDHHDGGYSETNTNFVDPSE